MTERTTASQTGSTDPGDADIVARLERALRKMRRMDREVFLAHRLDGSSYGEIAERTGLSVDQVERSMARVIYRVHRELSRPQRRWRFWPF